MLSTALIPVYFASIADPGSSVVVAWGYAETVASLVLALLMPVLGSLADLAGDKKKFLVGFAGTGAVACAALGIPEHALVFGGRACNCRHYAEWLNGVLRRLFGGCHYRRALRQGFLPTVTLGVTSVRASRSLRAWR